MDREKVIKGLQEIVDDNWMKTHADWYVSVCSDALAILKEQEAVEPVLDSFLHKRCPSCMALLNGKFCHECGQAVKWMPNREKVIKGLELCEIGSGDRCYETECPYYKQECTESLKNDLSKLEDKKMFVNPMDSLPGYGAILKNHFKLNVEDEERRGGDLVAAVLDYLIGIAWRNFGLFPKEEEKHRNGTSIMEIQSFLDWVVPKLIDDMEFTEAQKDEINKEYVKAIQEFLRSGDEEETDVT